MKLHSKFVGYVALSFIFIGLILSACDKKDPIDEPETSAFDRRAMLEHWADHIIVPGLKNYQQKLDDLSAAGNAFIANAQQATLTDLRSAWLAAYTEWQKVSMFEIGKAEELGLRNFTNIYPTNVDEIEANLVSTDLNLALPSTFDAQGFPALDYLLFGLGDTDTDILALLSQEDHANYLIALIDRLGALTGEVVSDWEGGYRDEFVDADGSSASASTDKVVNDFLFYYERFLRAGKIGIPAGVFSGSKEPQAVEGRFSKIHSRDLFLEALGAAANFFDGQGPGRQGISLREYLNHASNRNGTPDIVGPITNHWRLAKNMAEQLDPDLQTQVENDNLSMLAVYDELQQAVVLLKVDMMQALNIQVDYVDADGD